MKKIINICLIFILSISLSAPLLSLDKSIVGSSGGDFQKVGAAGAQFLKIAYGARGIGMGGAYTAAVNDLSSLYFNPAGIAETKAWNADFSYTQWFAGFSHAFAGISMPLGSNFMLAAHLIRFGSKDIEITTFEESQGTGLYYSVSDICGGVTLAGFLTDRFSFGVTAKFISNSFASASASGFAFDIGTKYETGIQGIKLGFAIMNLGTQQSYSGQDLRTTKKLNDAFYQAPLDAEYISYPFSLPLAFRAGVSSEVFKNESNKVTAAFDFVTMSDVTEQYALGAEWTWENLLSVRAGYLMGQSQFGFSGGLGLKYVSGSMDGSFDYSLSPTKDFGLVNRFTISVNLK